MTRDELLESAYRKNAWRLVVLLAIAYVVNYLDRNNISVAASTMSGRMSGKASPEPKEIISAGSDAGAAASRPAARRAKQCIGSMIGVGSPGNAGSPG